MLRVTMIKQHLNQIQGFSCPFFCFLLSTPVWFYCGGLYLNIIDVFSGSTLHVETCYCTINHKQYCLDFQNRHCVILSN